MNSETVETRRNHTDQLINNHPDNLNRYRGMQSWSEGTGGMSKLECGVDTFYRIMGLWDDMQTASWVVNVESRFIQYTPEGDPVYHQRFYVVGQQKGYIKNITRDVWTLLHAIGHEVKYIRSEEVMVAYEPVSVVIRYRLQKALLEDGILDIIYHVLVGEGY